MPVVRKTLLAATAALFAASIVVVARADDQSDARNMRNLRAVGQAIVMYAVENRGWLPADLGHAAVVAKSAEIFLDESNADRPDASVMQNDAALSDWVNQHADVMYLASPPRRLSSLRRAVDTPIATMRPQPGAKTLLVLFADGHVERFVPTDPRRPARNDAATTRAASAPSR